MKILVHPANVDSFRAMLKGICDIHPTFAFERFEICRDPSLPVDVPSGKYIQPDGRIVEKADISIKTRWIEYGPEDFDWLMFARIIKEHRERYYLVIDDSKLRQIHSQPLTMKLRSQF